MDHETKIRADASYWTTMVMLWVFVSACGFLLINFGAANKVLGAGFIGGVFLLTAGIFIINSYFNIFGRKMYFLDRHEIRKLEKK